MPELPEVETVVRGLRGELLGRTIIGVSNDYARQLTTHTAQQLAHLLTGQSIITIHRRAKYIVLTVDNGQRLLIHLRMTGHLHIVSAPVPRNKHDHTIFLLNDGDELRFNDIRKFGTIALVATGVDPFAHLGPEPLESDFTPERLQQQLGRRKTKIKPLLLDQTVIAGIGNIYADEALFFAKIDPRRGAETLNGAEIAQLHAGIQHVLRLGIAREGASVTNYIKPNGEKGGMQEMIEVFRRTGAPCYRCETPIERIILGGRSTHFCPHCQS